MYVLHTEEERRQASSMSKLIQVQISVAKRLFGKHLKQIKNKAIKFGAMSDNIDSNQDPLIFNVKYYIS